MTDVTRYPLAWPNGWPRTPKHKRGDARFSKRREHRYGYGEASWVAKSSGKVTIADALARLAGELDRLGATRIVVSTNVETRKTDGMPKSSRRQPDDPGVAVYFHLKGAATVLACDRWRTVADNLAAVAAHIGALRGIDRWGVGTIEQAFTGYQALPESTEASTERAWWEVLGVDPLADWNECRRAYREKSKEAHPDAGGTVEMWEELTKARQQAHDARAL